jgi:hypothetical protein
MVITGGCTQTSDEGTLRQIRHGKRAIANLRLTDLDGGVDIPLQGSVHAGIALAVGSLSQIEDFANPAVEAGLDVALPPGRPTVARLRRHASAPTLALALTTRPSHLTVAPASTEPSAVAAFSVARAGLPCFLTRAVVRAREVRREFRIFLCETRSVGGGCLPKHGALSSSRRASRSCTCFASGL